MRLFVGVILLTVLSAINVTAQMSEIHQAVIGRNLQKVKSLLKANPSLVNAKDQKDGNTPLHLAASLGDETMVKLLVAEHADINAKNNRNETPLDLALDLETDEAGFALGIIKILLDHGANIQDAYLFLFGGDLDEDSANILVQLFLQHGANPNVTGNDGSTPLDNAVDAKDEEAVASLRKYGALSGFEIANGEVKNGELTPKDLDNIERLREGLASE